MGRVFAVVTIALCFLTSCGGDPGADPDPLSVWCEEIERGSVSTLDCEGANLRNANLQWAALIGADLRDANLSGVKYGQNEWGENTVWPSGFNPPPSS